MSRTIGQVRTVITSRLHGTTLNKVSDFYTICQDAAELVLARIDPQETIRKTALTNAVYDKVYDYSLPADFKAPQNLNPQANPEALDNGSLARTYSRQFSNRKKDNQFAILWRDTLQFLRFKRNVTFPAVINPCDSLTTGGTWTIGGNASNLTLDTLNYVSGIGALMANASSSGALVNVILRIGNDSSNYFHRTVTTGHFDAFLAGWNLLRFDFNGMTEVGSVDMENIDYVRVTVTYNTNQTAYFECTLSDAVNLSENYEQDGSVFLYMCFDSITSLSLVRLDNITANLGVLYDITYYSNYLFRNTSGTWLAKPTSDNDIVNLSPVSYKIFEAEICRIIAQQVQGAMGIFDYTYWDDTLEGDTDNGDSKDGLYAQYLRQYPSERFEGQTEYYRTGIDNTLDWGVDDVDDNANV